MNGSPRGISAGFSTGFEQCAGRFFVVQINRVEIEVSAKGGSEAGGSEISRKNRGEGNRAGIQTSKLCNYTVGSTIFTGRKENVCAYRAKISQCAIELGKNLQLRL